MALIETPGARFTALKKETPLLYVNPTCTQETIEIRRVAPSGLFEIGKDLYSKTYEFSDVNYSGMSYPEQVTFFDSWNHVVRSFKYPFKITILNRKRNMKKLERNILYPMQNDIYDEARECYNDIMRNKLIEEKQGMEQHRYLTMTVNKKGGYQAAEKALASLEGGCMKEFANMGSKIIPLSGDERLQLLHDFYMEDEEDYEVSIERAIEEGNDWRNDIICGNLEYGVRQIMMNGKYVRALFIDPHSYGTSLEDDFFVELSSLSACSIFTVDYVPVGKELTKKVLESKYIGIESMISKQANKRVQNKNFVSETSYRLRAEKEEIEEMLDMVRNQEQEFLWVGITMVVAADTLDELERLTAEVEQTCAGAGCKLGIAIQMQREALNTALPIGVRNMSYMRAMFTQSAAGFIPFHTMELMDEEHPFYYGANKESGNPILYNRKKLMNSHGFVFGKSGSGKSFTGSKLEIGSVYLTTEDDIIIIDPQNEYEETCEAFGGSYINFASYTKNYINPLHCDVEDLDELHIEEIIKEKAELLNSIAEHSLNGYSGAGLEAIVDRCTRNMFQKIIRKPKGERYVPTMEDFYHAAVEQVTVERKRGNLTSAEIAEELSLAMERFVNGALDIFNHQTNIDMNNRVIVFGIRDLGESLWSLTMTIMMSLITNRVKHNFTKGIFTWLYVDEFHYMTKTPYTKMYVVEAWKTLRKFGGIATGLTQNAIDLLKDPDTTTLVSNSEYTLFMKQSPKDVEVILSAFDGMSEEQLADLTTAAKGTGIIRFGDVVIPMDNRIETTNPIYGIFSTDPHEKAALKRAKRKNEKAGGVAL